MRAPLSFQERLRYIKQAGHLEKCQRIGKSGSYVGHHGPSGKCRNLSPYLYKANGASCLIISLTPVSQEDIGEDLFLFYTSY